MTPFSRPPAPAFWATKEERWRQLGPHFGKRDPLNDWTHQGLTLGDQFRERVGRPSEPTHCAYCDTILMEGSRSTIDHFAPRSAFPDLALAWDNLFPACDLCNTKYKAEQWSCRLVRPDTDPVDDWFGVDMSTGALRASTYVEDRVIRARVRLTIVVLRLNTERRCKSRLRVIRAMEDAWKKDAATSQRNVSVVDEYVKDGPYRFLARIVRDALPASTRDPAALAR